VLRQDTTEPAVTSVAVAPPRSPTDFDPTEPMGVTGAPSSRPAVPGELPSAAREGGVGNSVSPVSRPAAGFRATADPAWDGFTVSDGASEAAAPAAPLAPSLPVSEAEGLSASDPAVLPWYRRPVGLAALAAGTAFALIGAFVWTIPSPRPVGAAASPASAVAVTVRASQAAIPGPEASRVVAEPPPAAAPPAQARNGDAIAGPAATTAVVPPPPVASGTGRSPARSTPGSRDRERDRDRAAPGTAQAGVTGPEERCAGHMFLTRLICIKRECDGDPRLHNHPECVKLAKAEQERRDRMMQR